MPFVCFKCNIVILREISHIYTALYIQERENEGRGWSLYTFVVPRNLAGRHATPGQMPNGKMACRQGEMDMTLPRNMPPNTVGVQVELCSMARLVCGRSLRELALPSIA